MKIFNVIYSSLLCILFFYLCYLLNDLGLLYNKIALAVCIILGIVVLLIVYTLLKMKDTKGKKKGKKKNKKLKITLYTVGTIILLISGIGVYFLGSAIDFIDNFGNSKEKYDYYYVIVNKESKYTKLSDLENKVIGKTEELSKEVLDKIDINYEEKVYETNNALITSLYEKNIDAIIISDIGEYLLEEEDEDFTKKVRIIKTIKIKKEENIESSKKDITKDTFIVYISGIDTSGRISKVSRSDVNMLATINPKTHQVLLTSIPRDYYVQLHGTTGTKDKLTHAGIYGIDMSITTIEDLLDIDIDYYARVNFDTVTNLVDQIGGISIYSDQNLHFCNIKKGYNNVNGKCALQFARERKSYATGDRHRGENQEEVIRAIISKVQKSPAILTKYNSIMTNLQNNFETNVSNDVIKKFIGIQLKDMPSWDVKSLNLNGKDSHNYTYSGGSNMLYVMEPDKKSVDSAKSAIKGITKGKSFYELGLE